MRFLNNLKRNSASISAVLNYINRCHLIYKRVISEANKRENDRLVKKKCKLLNKTDVAND